MKITASLALLFVLVLVGGYGLSTGRDTYAAPYPASSTTAPSRTTDTIAAATSTSVYTMAQVSGHNTAQDCWAAINGSVYNLTSWISQHPGGEAPILSLCGRDGTSAFEGQHANNARANQMLATFRVGALSS